MRRTPLFPTLLTVLALTALSSCAPGPAGLASADSPTPVGSPTPVDSPTPTVQADFPTGTADFSVKMLQHQSDGQRNTLVSPLSIQFALALTANGASGQTLAQMEQVLGGMPIADLNTALPGFVQGLPSTNGARFHLANSVWYNQAKGVNVQPSFLQLAKDTYGAGAFGEPFDEQTAKDINSWVSKNTDGMIPKMVDQLDPSLAMVLLNALAFDAEWASPYMEPEVQKGTFTDAAGQKQQVEFMYSDEHLYLDDGKATGFAKSYADDSYRFVGLLPNEGVALTDYVASLTGKKLMATLAGAQDEVVHTSLPEFSFEYSASLKDGLTAMGMPDAFTPSADFSRMGTMNGQPLRIDDVLHKTFIEVTPLGTRAGAATAVIMEAGAAPGAERKVVHLDRPFVFAIVDGKTNLPLFLGVVNSVDAKA